MTQEEIDTLEQVFQRQGFTPEQINFVVAVIRNRVEPLLVRPLPRVWLADADSERGEVK